uniref:Kinesin motor domain-containing protein n=1 Tax=Hyaloperonospora arabidopsidis (strain Emoy2) TaxID=559515 RepID=M4BH37_HYAAE
MIVPYAFTTKRKVVCAMDSDRFVTPEHARRYEAGSGNILSYFASLGTPDISKQSDCTRRSVGVQRSDLQPKKQQAPVKVFDDFVIENQTENSYRSSELSVENAAEFKSYAMSFSPPSHSLKKSRREANVAAQTSTAGRSTYRSSSSMEMSDRTDGFMEEEESYSPVTSSVKFLMSRDPEEEERVLSSKSDKDKVYLYKKRYIDTYEHAVALLKHAAALERERVDKQSDLEYLRSTIKTQTQIISALSENQLSQRNTLIDSLHEERVRVSTGMQFSDDFQDKLETALREKQEALESEARVLAQLDDLKLLYEKCEAARSALSDGLDRAEKQTTALHTQWVQEKKKMLASVQQDDQKLTNLAAECERLRNEKRDVKNSLFQSLENEKKYLSTIGTQRQAVDRSQLHVSQLQSELSELRSQLRLLSDKETKTTLLESDLSRSKEKLRRCSAHMSELKERLKQKEEEVKAQFLERAAVLEQRVFDAESVRRSLHNKVMELKGNIRVFCRVRPVLRHELARSKGEEIFAFPDYHTKRRQIELSANPKSHVGYGQNGLRGVVKKYSFGFDLVFGNECSQEDVFLEVSALIQSALDGYNVCIFAYGQTGSGKTYTMQGKEEDCDSNVMESSPDMGIVGRAISHIFASIDDMKLSGWNFIASLELVEIYNETLRDLLAPTESTDKVELRLDSEGKTTVMNSCVHDVKNEQEAWSLLRGTMSKRSTKSTKMNYRSSRSHCVITFRLSGVNSLTGDQRTGVINLVDLAVAIAIRNF